MVFNTILCVTNVYHATRMQKRREQTNWTCKYTNNIHDKLDKRTTSWKDEAGLQDIAQQLNVKDIEGKSKENLIYDILDAQAEQTAGNETPVKRRTRIVKRNEADHIFSTNLTPAKSAESDAEEAASAKNKLRKRQMKMPNPKL